MKNIKITNELTFDTITEAVDFIVKHPRKGQTIFVFPDEETEKNFKVITKKENLLEVLREYIDDGGSQDVYDGAVAELNKLEEDYRQVCICRTNAIHYQNELQKRLEEK